MEKKYSFKIVRAADTTALSDFRCGVQSMDAFIHDKVNGLAKFIQMGLSNLWIVFEGSKAVAFFALSKDALMLNGDDIHTIGNDEALETCPGSFLTLFRLSLLIRSETRSRTPTAITM